MPQTGLVKCLKGLVPEQGLSEHAGSEAVAVCILATLISDTVSESEPRMLGRRTAC